MCALKVFGDSLSMTFPEMEASYLEDVSVAGRLFSFPDKNNNTGGQKGEKYSLRPRSTRSKRHDEEDIEDSRTLRKCKGKEKQKPAPLSKYRRKTANARERSRMREINAAFETLRRCVPSTANAVPQHSEKLTKITTLRLAMQYISTLSNALSSTHQETLTTSWLTDCDDLDLLLESDGESLPLSDHSLLASPDQLDDSDLFPEHDFFLT